MRLHTVQAPRSTWTTTRTGARSAARRARGGPAELVTLHRAAGVAVAVLVTVAGLAAARSGPPRARRAALVAPVLVAVQVLLGAWTVWSLISVPVVSLHLAAGALLLADAITLYLLLGPQPVSAGARADRAPGLVPAAG